MTRVYRCRGCRTSSFFVRFDNRNRRSCQFRRLHPEQPSSPSYRITVEHTLSTTNWQFRKEIICVSVVILQNYISWESMPVSIYPSSRQFRMHRMERQRLYHSFLFVERPRTSRENCQQKERKLDQGQIGGIDRTNNNNQSLDNKHHQADFIRKQPSFKEC